MAAERPEKWNHKRAVERKRPIKTFLRKQTREARMEELLETVFSIGPVPRP
jgi:hypothetical protein